MFSGETGSIKSFNYDTTGTYEHLQAQDYQVRRGMEWCEQKYNITQVCIRREYGHCRIGWRQAADRDSFKLSRGAASYNGAAGPGTSNCDPDAAIIIGNNQTYCYVACITIVTMET